jgi:hypothetical protein
MITLNRAMLNPMRIRHAIQTLLTHRPQRKMIPQQAAQQLPPARPQLRLQLTMLKRGSVTISEPSHDPLKPLPRALTPIPPTILTPNIPPLRQEILTSRRNHLVMGAGVGEHVGLLSVDVT